MYPPCFHYAVGSLSSRLISSSVAKSFTVFTFFPYISPAEITRPPDTSHHVSTSARGTVIPLGNIKLASNFFSCATHCVVGSRGLLPAFTAYLPSGGMTTRKCMAHWRIGYKSGWYADCTSLLSRR
ncbi:hypothetical protein KCP75_05775 [Salmonella enterica subsp. enterica]|nr:hypothetical protein KCP75_05775 [Salmonella enterica subsp. enterica]